MITCMIKGTALKIRAIGFFGLIGSSMGCPCAVATDKKKKKKKWPEQNAIACPRSNARPL